MMDPTLLIGDIVERDDDKPRKPVTFDDAPFEATPTGFPKNRRRWRPTKKAEPAPPAAKTNDAGSSAANTNMSFDEAEKQRIDAENRQRLDDMTPEEIKQAQEDLMSGLNPALIQRLLRRANIDQEPSSSRAKPPVIASKIEEAPASNAKKATVESVPDAELKKPAAAEQVDAAKPTDLKPSTTQTTSQRANPIDDQAPAQIPPDLFPITDPPQNTHFPVPPPLPDLDPSDPDFLETLHKKYFPDLPADPSKMAWMAPVPTPDSTADKESPYYPHPEISVNALRFDFRGRFLSPRVSRKVPSSKGLHHHGLAPEAAGYTVAELAHLARSAVPAQRCMAYQTLGRILYRLGQGEWGKTQEHPIAMGIWGAVKEGRVLQSLTEAATAEGGHQGSRAYATEALWLFEKGGWREPHQGR